MKYIDSLYYEKYKLEAELELINAKIEREYKIMGDGCYMPPYCNVRKIYDADMNFVAIEQIY